MEKIYYNCKDVIEVTGCSQSLAYSIIRQLRESFKEKYPDAITIQGKIPKWYFEEIMKVRKEERGDQNEN